MARLKSPHVARVLDAGAGPEGSPYLVMELLEGEDLGTRLKRNGPFPPEEAAGYVLEACLGLAEAHAVGIIHRDLKPANLFLATLPDGSTVIKIVDFGISKLVDQGEVTLTSPETLLGSPAYMAPEQMASAHHVDGRADIWSLGAILFRLVTGQHTFAAESSIQRLHALLHEEPRRLRDVAPGAPAELEAIIARCLARDPSGRYPGVGELATDLAAFLGRRPPSMPAPRFSTTPPPQIATIRDAPTRHEGRHRTGAREKLRRRALFLAIGLASAALLGGVYLQRGRHRTDGGQANPPTPQRTTPPTPPERSAAVASASEPPAPGPSASSLPVSASVVTPSTSVHPVPPMPPQTVRPLSGPSANPFDGRL